MSRFATRASKPIGVFLPPIEAKRRLNERFPYLEQEWMCASTTRPTSFCWMKELALVALGVRQSALILFDYPGTIETWDPEIIWLCECAGVIVAPQSIPANTEEFMYDGILTTAEESSYASAAFNSCLDSRRTQIEGLFCFLPENAYLHLIFKAFVDYCISSEGASLHDQDRTRIGKWLTMFPKKITSHVLQSIIYGYSNEACFNWFTQECSFDVLAEFTRTYKGLNDDIEITHDMAREAIYYAYKILQDNILTIKRGFQES